MTNNKGDEKAKEPKDLSPKPPYSLRSAEQELKDVGKATNDWIKQVLDDQYREKSLKLQRASAFKTNKYTHALDLIIERAKYHNSPSICIDLKDLIFENTSDDVKTLTGWFEELKAFGGFKHYSKQNYTGGVRFYLTGLNIEKLKRYKKTQGNSETNKTTITIKNIRLDDENYFLEINDGEKIIPFKSRKKGKGLGKETKQFKILYHLWDFRWELKDDNVLKKGEFVSLDNLARGSGSESKGAAHKHIQRLNTRFENEGVAIKISGENEKYRLIINKT